MRTLTFGLVVALSSLPSAIHAAQSAATIAGRVVDADREAPLGGARVILLRFGSAGPVGPPAQIVTGDDGRYEFSGLAEGSYRLQVQRVGFIQPFGGLKVEVGAGQTVAGPELRLNRGGAITGRVLDARGEPIANLIVTASRNRSDLTELPRGPGDPLGMPVAQPGQTNDIGEFRIAGLATGNYYVSASPRLVTRPGGSSASGSTKPVTTYYPGTAMISEAQVLSVAAGQTIGNLEFRMIFAPDYSIAGVVLDEKNMPVAGDMVTLMLALDAGPGPRGSARTGPDGTFRIGGIAPGEYRLSASIPVAFESGGGRGAVTFAADPSSMIPVTVVDRDVVGLMIVVRKPVTR